MKTQFEILKLKFEKDVVLIQKYLDTKIAHRGWCPDKYEKKINTLNNVIKVIDMHLDLETIMDDTICGCTRAVVFDVYELIIEGVAVENISAGLSQRYPETPQRCGMCTDKVKELGTMITNIT